MVADNFQKILHMLEALVKFTEILAQRSASPSVSHEPGPTPASTTAAAAAALLPSRHQRSRLLRGETQLCQAHLPSGSSLHPTYFCFSSIGDNA
ncbi:hypothetical protein RND71_030351 [Anisodus tanguticus]|uniref:Uncharacterized protein n=1 Tax=Anisodus tanguticus TaxID=243964 RepID=A0AAE1UZL6_9SOLA|nr:hypothetical protein RND71_030351 [Anisodus tanguticus]